MARFIAKEFLIPRHTVVDIQKRINVAVEAGANKLRDTIKSILSSKIKHGPNGAQIIESWKAEATRSGTAIVFSADARARFLNDGTGVYGTRGSGYVITPKAGRMSETQARASAGMDLGYHFRTGFKHGLKQQVRNSVRRPMLKFQVPGQSIRYHGPGATHQGTIAALPGEMDTVFASKVFVKGIRPLKYVEDALDLEWPAIEAAIEDATYQEIEEAFKDIGVQVMFTRKSGIPATGTFKSGPRAGQAFAKGAGGRFVG